MGVTEPIRIRPRALAAIAAHAGSHRAEEVCGCLLGQNGLVVAATPADNVLPAEERPYRFELDPLAHAVAALSGRLVGYYHSHIDSAPAPSLADGTGAVPGKLVAIYSLTASELGVWRARGDGTLEQLEWELAAAAD